MYSYIYNQQPLYRLMIWNIKDQIKSQNPNKPSSDDINIFNVTSIIGVALGISKETVMNDYIQFCKS